MAKRKRATKTKPAAPQRKLDAFEPFVPDPPADLQGVGLAAWLRIAPSLNCRGLMSAAYSDALRLLCDAISQYHQFDQQVRDEGPTLFIGEQDHPTPNPAIKNRSEAWGRYLKGLREFGLTPASFAEVTQLEADATLDEMATLGVGATG